MTIASEKLKLATERFLLVRLNPARFIQPSLLSGSVYEMTLPLVISHIELNGVSLTKVITLSGNNQWTHNETTQTFQVQLASAPNSTTNVLICYYYLFYTGSVFRSISQDPQDSATTVREWKPRIQSYPSFSQSFANILAGVFTISDTSVSIINADAEFQGYLTDNDSFYGKKVDIWLCINSVLNIQKVFTGTITRLTLSQDIVTLDILDSFIKLKQPAYMGDTVDEAIFRRDANSFPNLDPKHNDSPVPYIVGSSSRYKTFGQRDNVAGAPDPYLISVGTEAYCTNFSAVPTVSNNRQWGCCRIKGSVATQAFGTIQETVSSGTGYRFVRFSTLTDVSIGDTIKWTEAATVYYGLVYHVGTFTYLTVNYNIIIGAPDGPFTLSSTVANLKSFVVFIDVPQGITKYVVPRLERDYSLSETATTGGNTYVSLTFGSDFEASHNQYPLLNPDQQEVFFKTSNTVVQKHGNILKEILTKVGLSVNTATFTTADTTLPVNCRFHIPNFDEQDADDYLKYVEDVLSSTLGYLKINTSFEIEYHLLDSPVSTDVRDNFLMLEGSTRLDVEYEDIVTKIIGFNPHNDSGDAIDDANTPAATAESTKARYLHGLVNVDRFRHVLEELTSKISDHIGLKSTRRVRYAFETATQDIDTELGDDLQLENQIILGTTKIQDLKIVSIEKSPSRIRIEASDLKGI